MKCSICNEEGHRSNNRKYHPVNTTTPETAGNSGVVVLDVKKSATCVTDADAEKSASEWAGTGESLMRTWLIGAIKDRRQHRDIGKVLANIAELHVIKVLSEKSGRIIKKIEGEPYDAITTDGEPCVKIQIKFRMDSWHFETTRRNSQKNADTNGTGHIAYKKDEFDMVAIFKPSPTFGITDSCIRCIPTSALIHPTKPDQLITQINGAIRRTYDNADKSDDVIAKMLQIQPLLLD